MKKTIQKSIKSELCNRLNEVYKHIKKTTEYTTQKLVSEKINFTRSNFSAALNGDERFLTEGLVDRIVNAFPEFNKAWIMENTGEMLNSTPEEEYQLPKSELKPKTYEGSIKVRLVTNTAKAGWSDGYYADEYLKDMPVVIVEADENYKGNYMAFEVEGDSMEPDYIEGNIVICREVQRHLWQSKLHYRDWDFVIAHAKDGIYLKEIINHDVEKGIITCHSLNPNYKDFKIDLREVAHLYNVVETRQQGRNKRWNRAKDFFETEE